MALPDQRMRPRALLLRIAALTALVWSLWVAPAQGQAASLERDPELRGQSDCVQYCLVRNGFHPVLYFQVGCAEGRSHACVCHEQRRSMATRHVASCITTDLSTSNCASADYASAISVYNRYCSFGAAPAATGTATATATVSGARTSTPTAAHSPGSTLATNTRLPSSSASSSSSSSSSAAGLVDTLLSLNSELLLLLAAGAVGANLLW
jgi:hypothetical protein